uniref:Uncharacterized protein n=1 Tax=Anguilla anguilla TaxID=7936 RepID=A0A0E9R9Q9_ANGAN
MLLYVQFYTSLAVYVKYLSNLIWKRLLGSCKKYQSSLHHIWVG